MTIQNEIQSDHLLFVDLDTFHADPKNKLNVTANGTREGTNTPYVFWPPTHSIFFKRLG